MTRIHALRADVLLPAAAEAAPQAIAPANPGADQRRKRWGVILAGGDGTRLRPLTRFICGDERPKQFCPIYRGGVSLLERTRQRLARSIPSSQTLFALTRAHRQFYTEEPAPPASQRIVQPLNRGTAPPILHSLLSIARLDSEALVAVMPCDHHYADEALLTSTLEAAFDLAAQQSAAVILLAAQPTHPELGYGWIETEPAGAGQREDLLRVRAFREKPSAGLANALFRGGSLWNTFVMIGAVGAFLSMTQAALPELVTQLGRTQLWTGAEIHIEEAAYARIPSTDFSRQVLADNASRLTALRLGPIGWSDLGDPERALQALGGGTREPAWAPAWRLLKQMRSAPVAVGAG